jgi:hypothetical protein
MHPDGHEPSLMGGSLRRSSVHPLAVPRNPARWKFPTKVFQESADIFLKAKKPDTFGSSHGLWWGVKLWDQTGMAQ